jgi:hypothetical protein
MSGELSDEKFFDRAGLGAMCTNAMKSFRKGVWGRTIFQKGFPQKEK